MYMYIVHLHLHVHNLCVAGVFGVCTCISHSILVYWMQVVTHYLVKWKSLPYEDATWELEVQWIHSNKIIHSAVTGGTLPFRRILTPSL